MGLFGSNEKTEDIRYNAMSMMEKNQPKAAISLFNKILKQNDSDIDALLNKGLALNQVKKYSDAIANKERWLVFTKSDLEPEGELKGRIQEVCAAIQYEGPTFVISAVTHHGTNELIHAVLQHLELLKIP